MSDVFVCGVSAITSLGLSVDEQIEKISQSISGVRKFEDGVYSPEPYYGSHLYLDDIEIAFSKIGDNNQFTKFEKICILSVHQALEQAIGVKPDADDTLFVISTTKGNIDLLDKKNAMLFDKDRVHLWKAAEIIAGFFGNKNKPMVVSNACISGVLAIATAKDLISHDYYKNVIVVGGDIASEFVVSGFQSFKSLSFGICKPYDINRDGLNLGEGAGCMILSSEGSDAQSNTIKVCGGASSNDANHISGPSRTGDGLLFSINKALEQSGLQFSQIDFISGHGTATPFNDEMESKAFSQAGLSEVPLNSFKGYFGHTLGAAGIIESVFSIEGMKRGEIYPTLGFTEFGCPEKLTIVSSLQKKEQQHILKTASGFGGSNAAIVFSK